MANLAYLSIWFRDFTIERGTHHLEALLTLFPFAETRPDLRLVIRSLDPSQGVSAEEEGMADPELLRERCAEFLHDDTAYEVGAFWDLWQWERTDGPLLEWSRTPSAIEFNLHGPDYDARAGETGHIWMHLGAENLYLHTDHGGATTGEKLKPEEMDAYRRHIRENVMQLKAFVREMEESLPIERLRMWSEGETDFAAVTEQTLSASE